jgi:hypothetical protein
MVLLLVLVLGAPAVARAGDEGTDLGNAGGMNYRVSIFEDFSGPAFNSFAACLDGDRPISGGIDLEGTGNASRMGGTYPAKEGSIRLWRSQGLNLVGGMMDMSFFAICREIDASLMKLRSVTRPFNPGKKRTVKVACPDGFRAIGGGIESPEPLVTATVPYDAGDNDKKPDDGWKAAAVNASAVERDLTAHVSCRKAGSWELHYENLDFGIGGGLTASAGVLCTPGDLTGGGASIAGPDGTVRVHESFPIDAGDAGNVTPADGWHGSLTNGEMGSTSGTVHAICKV